MGALSFFQKDKQESAAAEPEDSGFQSRAEEESNAVRAPRKRRKGKASGDQPVDPVLPEKKRARRRLIGAVALVLAAVIGLPMVLDSEPKPLADDIAIQIPSKDKAPAMDAAPVKKASPNPSSSRAPVESSLDKNEQIVAMPTAPNPETAKASPPAPQAAMTTPVAPLAPTAQKSGVKPEAKAETAAVAKIAPEARDAAKPGDADRARAILEGRNAATAEKTKTSFEKKPSKFMVQVAALASQDKVSELQGKLRNAGIKSQTQKVATQSGERIRVRVGPFASKEDAEKMRARLGKIGLNGSLFPA